MQLINTRKQTAATDCFWIVSPINQVLFFSPPGLTADILWLLIDIDQRGITSDLKPAENIRK